MNVELLEKIKNAEDIIPEKHDGSYQLVRETVAAYSRHPELEIKKADIILIIRLSTIQIREDSTDDYIYGRSSEKGHSEIVPCNLPDYEKDGLSKFFHDLWGRREQFENFRVTKGIGMFKGDMRSCSAIDDESARIFIELLIELYKSSALDDESYFKVAERYLVNKLKGIEAGTASQILHCLKPNVFPVLNSVGRPGFEALDIVLTKPDKLAHYIYNCRQIKKFRDMNFSFKNYRVCDVRFWRLMEQIDLSVIADFLQNYGGKIYRANDSNGKIVADKGKKALAVMKQLCKSVQPSDWSDAYSMWQHSGYTVTYFWGELKSSLHQEGTISISVTFEKGQPDAKLSVKVEINNRRNEEERRRFNTLFRGQKPNDKVNYIIFGGKQPIVIPSLSEAVQKFNDKLYDRICPIIYIDGPYTMDRAAAILQDMHDAIETLLPYYESFFNENEVEIISVDDNETENSEGNKTMANLQSKNIILYGPPGTGKTYNTVMQAVEIIDGKDKWKEKDYCEIKARYDELLRENRIAFVTFHQSYGYEEFIEGIKPQTTDDGVTYEVQAGAFKEFCDRARVPIIDNGNLGINTTPTIWKVSLEGTYDNPTRKECLQNNHIRVGFDSYGKDVTSDTDFSVEGGKNVLNAFIGGMRIGDIVLSCYTNTTIDAIGVITGDYEWHDEFDKFKRVRNIRWIFKGKKDITDINGGKTFTLSTVYRLNDMSLSDVLNIVNGNDNLVKNAATTSNNTEKNKYVFIIDEINRGNISKIFGELITLIEENKREGAKEATSAKLPYSKTNFSVPDNVYIIGTMNTADRSIAAIDTALRRRFKFEEMMPKSDIIKCKDIDGIDISQMLDAINERIEVLYDREHMIGHAYFMLLEENATIAELADIFRNKIIPLLQEYFYEDYDKICLVLGDNQKKEEYRFIKSEDIAYDKIFGSASDIGFGEKNKKFTINDAAFLKKEAYIGIYAPTNE